MMQCDQVRSLLHRYVDGELDVVRRDALEAHLAHCESCAHELTDVRNVVSHTDRALSNVAAPPGFESAVSREIRSKTQFKQHGRRGFRWYCEFLRLRSNNS